MAPRHNGKHGNESSDRHKRQWKCSRCGEWTWLDKDRCHDCKGRKADFDEGVARGGEMPRAGPPGKAAGAKQARGTCGGERPQATTAEGFVKVGKSRAERRVAARAAKQLEKDMAELQQRREKDKQTDPSTNPAMDSDLGSEASEREAELGKLLKEAREDLAAVKGLGERLREELWGAAGGF